MKYIRTKDGIYDISNWKETDIYFEGENGFITKKRIIKQADTIEELCDELIIKNPNNDGEFYRKVFVYQGAWENILNEKHAKHCTNRDIYEHDVEIFGAIWTDKGLIYVAKMNEKGELELL